MGKSSAQKQQEQINLQLSQAQASQARQNAATQQALLAQQQQIYGQVSPFAQQLLNLGSSAANGQVNQNFVNAFLQPAQSQLTSSYGQARQNLSEALGSSGQWGSGVGAGPLAGLESNQARDLGNLRQQAYSQALQTALGYGLQGSNILQGQQAVFNPATYGSLGTEAAKSALVDPRQYASSWSGVLGGILGAGLGTVGSIFQGKG